MTAYPNTNGDTLSVFSFIQDVNGSLLAHRGRVVGEVTSVKDSYQTAVYFSIKDLEQDALLNCVIWRTTYRQNGVAIKEGDTVIVTGVPEIYPARGSFSMKVQTIEYAGEGALKKSYDALRDKLAQEGLLALGRKRAIPEYPRKIGVITSRSGVVIQDFSANLGRYGFQVTMVDSRVEGKDAIHELIAALRTLRKQDLDVLVIMRGGGSWESLQAFNTESVVRAIAEFPVPVVTGIGHDVDVTLAELVADVGASTPTAVAEVLNETWDTLLGSLSNAEVKIRHRYERELALTLRMLEQREVTIFRRYEQVLDRTRRYIVQTSDRLRSLYYGLERQITDIQAQLWRMMAIMRSELRAGKQLIDTAKRVVPRYVEYSLKLCREQRAHAAKQVFYKQAAVLKQAGDTIHKIEQVILRADPTTNLRLGYSLVHRKGKLIRSVRDLKAGEEVVVQVLDGSFISDIKKIQ